MEVRSAETQMMALQLLPTPEVDTSKWGNKPNSDRPLLCRRSRTSHTNDLTGWLNTSTDPSAFCCLYKPPAAAVPVGVPGDAAAGLIGAAGGAVTGCWATGCSKQHNEWLTGQQRSQKGLPTEVRSASD
jgi:hypothetical protein